MDVLLTEGTTFECVSGNEVLMRENGGIAVLNHMAAFLLHDLLSDNDPKDVSRTVIKRFDVNEAVVEKDIGSLLSDLCREGYVEIS